MLINKSMTVKGFYHLCSIAKLKPLLSHNIGYLKLLFMPSSLDYCNSLYAGIPRSNLARLVRNAAARFLTGTKKKDWFSLLFISTFIILLFYFYCYYYYSPIIILLFYFLCALDSLLLIWTVMPIKKTWIWIWKKTSLLSWPDWTVL